MPAKDPARPPKGWRAIQVGVHALWWRASPPAIVSSTRESSMHAPLDHIRVDVTIRRADKTGCKLVASFLGYRGIAVPAAGFADVQTIAIGPAVIARIVEIGAPGDAWPDGTGSRRVELEVPRSALPDLQFRPENLDGLTLVWKRE